VTRQGGNLFHGDVSMYAQNNALTSRNTTAAADNGRPYNRDTFNDISVQAGGPFVRDKLWFFGAFQNQRDYDSQPGVDPAYPAKNDARRVFWKFNYTLNANHRFMHGYHDLTDNGSFARRREAFRQHLGGARFVFDRRIRMVRPTSVCGESPVHVHSGLILSRIT
jgi:hypothetical protein